MEKLKALPFYKRFGFQVLLFNALLLVSIIAPSRIISKTDYKNLMNRVTFHGAFFNYCADRLSGINLADWPAAIEGFPGIFYQQRICVFSVDKELIYDSGIMRDFDRDYMLDNLLPDPYIDWTRENENLDPNLYIDYLTALDLSEVNPRRVFRSTRTVRYDAGADRIILSGKLLTTADGEEVIFTMSDSIVDMLISGRAVKERFLFLYCSVAILALGLTAVLSLSVTGPLRRLYGYSMEILSSPYRDEKPDNLPIQGEIGSICRALQSLIQQQKEQSEHFQRFSSDVVHE
ncbi:MAG: hypothetical protein JW760_04225, partial [Spirochaetales bacterium]|nr:hypothetical protein [Spirochaetales bacterium]